MPGTRTLESVIYLRQDALADALVRLLGEAGDTPSSDPPRQLTFPLAGDPLIKLWWDKPAVEIQDDDNAVLSVALAGGVRQLTASSEPGRIASLCGTVKAQARVDITYREGTAHLLLHVDPPDSLDLSGLRVRYADSNPLPLFEIDAAAAPPQEAIAQALAADVLASETVKNLLHGLMTRLAEFPLSYCADMLTGAIDTPAALVRVFNSRAGKVVAIGTSRSGLGEESSGDTPQLANVLQSHPNCNLAVVATSRWLSARLAHLVTEGAVEQRLLDSAGNELGRVMPLSVALHRGHVTFTAQATHAGRQAALAVDLGCDIESELSRIVVSLDALHVGQLDEAGLSAGAERGILLGGGRETPDDSTTEYASIHLAYWGEVLAILIGARYYNGTIQLAQRIALPGTSIDFEVPGETAALDEDSLTLYCTIPAAEPFKAQTPERQPKVEVLQDDTPTQRVPNQPVVATVKAKVVAESYQPYDYAWKADSRLYALLVGALPQGLRPLISPLLARLLPPRVLPRHQSQLTLTAVPSGIEGDPETVAKAQVAVIDAFGQVATAEKAVEAHPAKLSRGQRVLRRSLQATSVTSAVLVPVLVLAALGVVVTRIVTPPAGSGFQVLPLVQQICIGTTSVLPPSTIALDNTRGKSTVAWQATIEEAGPGAKAPWATFANGRAEESGTVAAGSTQTLTVRPSADLCARTVHARTRQVFHLSIRYANGQQVRVSEVVDLLLVNVHVAVAPSAPSSQTGQLTLTQSCNQYDRSNPVQPFSVVLDNTQSTIAANYAVIIDELAPVAAGLSLFRPPPSYWAQADAPNGSLPPGQSVSVTITPLSTLCEGMPPTAPTQAFHVFVTFGGSIVMVTDEVSPQIYG